MSYILDALQRADAERDRGRVPGLQSQHLPTGSAARKQPVAMAPMRALAVLAALTVVFALLALLATSTNGWQVHGANATEPPVSTTKEPPATPLSALAPMQTPSEEPASQATPQTAITPTSPSPILAPASPAAKKPTPAKASSRPEVPSLDELTAEARASLPVVHVSGSTHSQNPLLRTLIANGVVVQEGQDIVPGLRLERIGPRTAVFNHHGLRYRIEH